MMTRAPISSASATLGPATPPGTGPRTALASLRWGATFLAWPAAGLAAQAVAGPVDSPGPALLAGATAGAVIGAVQSLGAGRRVITRPVAWVASSAIGLGIGLVAGATAVGYATDLRALAVQGALSGLGLGLAQVPWLGTLGRRRLAWPALLTTLWALGWTVTTAVGVDVETQWAVFGASGALLTTAVTGLLMVPAVARAPRSGSVQDSSAHRATAGS
jgi:hypothetical protein